MAWIEVHQSLFTHRKTLMLASELGIDPDAAAMKMIRLWTWSLDNAPEGDLSGMPVEVIAFGAQWGGDAGEFVAALQMVGFLDAGPALHDWWDYAGKLIEQRKKNAERMRAARAKEKPPENDPTGHSLNARAGHVPITSSARAPATVPNRTVPNQTEKKGGGGLTKQAREETAAAMSVLDLGSDSGAVSLVEEGIRQFPDLRHGYEARKCREHYRDWARLDGKARAERYVKWLEKAQLFQKADAAKFNGPPRGLPADELPWLPDDPDDEARVRKWDEDLKAQAKTRGSKHG